MKLASAAFVCCAIVIAGFSSAFAQATEPACSLQILKGSYVVSASGFVRDFRDPGQNPIVLEGRNNFDGAGHVTESVRVMVSGTTPFEVKGATGTYTVNPDCSGSMVITGAVTRKFQIVGQGAEIVGIVVTPSYTLSYRGQKQFPQ